MDIQTKSPVDELTEHEIVSSCWGAMHDWEANIASRWARWTKHTTIVVQRELVVCFSTTCHSPLQHVGHDVKHKKHKHHKEHKHKEHKHKGHKVKNKVKLKKDKVGSGKANTIVYCISIHVHVHVYCLCTISPVICDPLWEKEPSGSFVTAKEV